MSVEQTIQKLLEESRNMKQLDEANEVVPAHSGDEPSNKKNMKVDQKEAEGGTSKKPNRVTQGAVAPESAAKLESEEQVEDEEVISELSNKAYADYYKKATQVSVLRGGKSAQRRAGIERATTGMATTAAKMRQEQQQEGEELELDMSDDVEALFNGEDGLTEEFRQKAETIFEAAVTSRIVEEVARITEALEEQYEQKLQEELETTVEGLVEHVDGYLNLMVEQWMENNVVALESGMKSDILESFVGGLKNLFEEHYIDVPEEKFDVVGDMEAKIEELNSKLDEAVAVNVALNQELNESMRAEIVDAVCEGLTDMEAEKLQTLAEEISFEDTETFAHKMQTIRENYFAKKHSKVETPSILTEETIQEEKTVPADMRAYVNTINTLVR